MTAGRTYLSIGDVLTLLRQEFPDVTISKIRFLESQGLVNPERTPSGYRKFYDHDVERLRWVLRQQREHFLPLKVIKGRLEDVTPESEPDSGSGEETESTTVRARPGDSKRAVDPGARAGNGHRRHEGAEASSGALITIAPSARGTGRPDPKGPSPLPGFDSGGQHRAAAAGASSTQPAARVAGVATAERLGPRAETSRQGPAKSASPAEERVEERADERIEPSASEGTAPSRAGTRQAAGADSSAKAGSRRWTAAELAEASGLSESSVAELASFGILSGRSVGGVVHYDESELAIAELAGAFAQFGIEPRHLRLYKHSSEREAGFVEQLVLPLLKQRNPEARKRAVEIAGELTRLGQGLRSALVQRSLQDLLGG
jgi:DNA-binding transcriptional MerR regulator